MIDVKETLKGAEDKMKKSASFLEGELSRIRAGRANIAVLDSVRVMSYGQMVPLNPGCCLAGARCPHDHDPSLGA